MYENAPEIVESAKEEIALRDMINREKLGKDILKHDSKWAYEKMQEIVNLEESEAVEWLERKVKE